MHPERRRFLGWLGGASLSGAAGVPALPSTGRYKIETFLAGGGIVLACAWAFGAVVSRFKEQDKLEQGAADRLARTHLIPGVLLQPNGIFAALRAQEAGCQYILAS